MSAYANWNQTFPEVAKNFLAIALGSAGFGYSDPPEGAPFGLDYWAKHVIALLDAWASRRRTSSATRSVAPSPFA